MATLTEFKTDHHHYLVDENGRLQGEYKSWYDNGQPLEHCHCVNDMRHGEYKRWYENGTIRKHCVYIADKKLDIDITNITHKDKFLLNLKYGDFHWLP